ncbi:MAG: hypothetical protein AMXMBFR59_31390 [Rhodanobacteraceae bacterium]
MEDQVAGERARADAAEQRCADVQAALQRATDDGAAEKQAHAQTHTELATTRGVAAVAQARAVDLGRQLSELSDKAAHEQAALQDFMTQRAAEFRDTLASRDRSYQAEIERATARLESAQNHMLQNVDAAREAQKRVEGQLAKLQQRYDALQKEDTEQRLKLGEKTRELHRHAAHRQQQDAEMQRLREEGQRLMVDLADVRGQLVVATTQIAAAEARAQSAETRLDRSLTIAARTRKSAATFDTEGENPG